MDENTARQLVEKSIYFWKEEMVQMVEHVKNNDLSAVKAKLHQIKGSAGNLRIKSLAFLADQAEEQIKRQEWENLARNIQEMQEQLMRLEQSIKN